MRARDMEGRLSAVTDMAIKEVNQELVKFFARAGWSVQHRSDEVVIMQRGPSGCTAALLLVLFFPLGLVYLFTDWGRKRVTVSLWKDDDGGTEVEFQWSNAAIRSDVESFLEWLEAKPE